MSLPILKRVDNLKIGIRDYLNSESTMDTRFFRGGIVVI